MTGRLLAAPNFPAHAATTMHEVSLCRTAIFSGLAPISLVLARCVLLLMFLASPVLAGDAAKGKILAQRWCASCHVVAPDQKRGSADVPSFARISETRKIAQIKGALTTGHIRMPDMALTRAEVDDLIAYIQTLAPPLEPLQSPPEKDTPPKTHRG